MRRGSILTAVLVAAVVALATSWSSAEAEAAGRGQPTDWKRFYYYPYVYYPHNFQRPTGSFNHLYYRYPQTWRIPVMREGWHNFYQKKRPYHRGHHFILDVF
tara:strand:- start:263 stop:568 length:306 start_codon:yes stop_codon:yes gene_type:complete